MEKKKLNMTLELFFPPDNSSNYQLVRGRTDSLKYGSDFCDTRKFSQGRKTLKKFQYSSTLIIEQISSNGPHSKSRTI